MDSGQKSHNSSHRPLWPEYKQFDKDYKKLFMLIGKEIIDEHGVTEHVESWKDVIHFVTTHNALLYTQSLTNEYHFPWLFEAVANEHTKVLCNQKGAPISVRIHQRKTYWVIRASVWGFDCDARFLTGMQEFFHYVGAGTFTTPSSLGHFLMKKMYAEFGFPQQTSLSKYCELFLREHLTGGMVQSPCVGNEYEELIELDKSSAYLAHWTVHPMGTGVAFRNGHCDQFETWFALCEIEIHHDLALGPFPVRQVKSRVIYPTLKGTYYAYLWKEQAMDCHSSGCSVRVHSGYGWRKMESYQVPWAQQAYWLRKNASTEFNERCCKAIAVAGIGHHSMRRERYYLAYEDMSKNDRYLTEDSGRPLRLQVVQESDDNAAIMLHWNNYTISQCNRDVYHFALPFAQEGRLVQLDYDSVLVLEKDERTRYIARNDMQHHNIEPGTWLWRALHDVKIVGPRAFRAREKNKLPGVKR